MSFDTGGAVGGAITGAEVGSVFGPWGAGIGAIGGGLFGGFSGNSSKSGSFGDANEFNAREAEKQRAWEQWMFGNRHQMEVADLRAAGLNPILSAGGQPPVPAGQSAASVQPNNFAQQNKLSRLELALASAKAISEIDLNKSQSVRNLAEASGSAGIPGFVKLPISKIMELIRGASAKGIELPKGADIHGFRFGF